MTFPEKCSQCCHRTKKIHLKWSRDDAIKKNESPHITFMDTFIASSSMEGQVRYICIYIYKHYTKLQVCLPKLQMRCLQGNESLRVFTTEDKARATQKQILKQKQQM